MTNKEFEVQLSLGTLDNYETLEDIILSTNMKFNYRLAATARYIRNRMKEGLDYDPQRRVPENIQDAIDMLIKDRVDAVNKWLTDFGIDLVEWKKENKLCHHISTMDPALNMIYPLHAKVAAHFNMADNIASIGICLFIMVVGEIDIDKIIAEENK